MMWRSPDADFAKKVYAVVRRIPAGRVSTYKQIATLIDPTDDPEQHFRLGARWVGTAMRRAPKGVPWQRVINSKGEISLPGDAGAQQRVLLEQEGIVFSAAGRVDFSVYGWNGEAG